MSTHISVLNEQAESIADFVERTAFDLHEQNPLMSEIFGISTFEYFIRLVVIKLMEFPPDLLEKGEGGLS